MKKEEIKTNIKKFLEKHKEKILVVCSITAGCVVTYLATMHEAKYILEDCRIDFGDFIEGVCAKKEHIEIPDMNDMRCLDIAKDGDFGKIVWLEDCTLKQMGKLGENLCKIEGVTQDMVTNMVIVNKDNINKVTRISF